MSSVPTRQLPLSNPLFQTSCLPQSSMGAVSAGQLSGAGIYSVHAVA